MVKVFGGKQLPFGYSDKGKGGWPRGGSGPALDGEIPACTVHTLYCTQSAWTSLPVHCYRIANIILLEVLVMELWVIQLYGSSVGAKFYRL